MQRKNEMKKKNKKRIRNILLALDAAVLLALAALGYRTVKERYELSLITEPAPEVEALLNEAFGGGRVLYALDGELRLSEAPATDEGRALADSLVGSAAVSLTDCTHTDYEGSGTLVISAPETGSLPESLRAAVESSLCLALENAARSSDIYDEDRQYRPEAVSAALSEAEREVLAGFSPETVSKSFSLELAFTDGSWEILNLPELNGDIDADAEALYSFATGNLTHFQKHYHIEETAKAGPVPDQSNFGETDDPAVVTALLQTPLARELIADRQLVFNEDIPFIEGTKIRYYLDETLLAIEWQEPEALACGTFMEVITADGSQLRRKLAGDVFGGMHFDLGTNLARQANAVFAFGGDLYNHQRNCGIVVYERQIYRFDPETCDTCYITSNGDMLFSYRYQFSQQYEAQQFIEDNDVLFSLCFGPVLIDNGEDKTPWMYPWGEINDEYARAALGQLGEHHYLTLNLNCLWPNYYYLVTLRQAADAMIKRGCINAYALDGGQTATTIVNGVYINPVQFGEEKVTSDIIYFATALPDAVQ